MQFYEKYIGGVLVINITHDSYSFFCNTYTFFMFELYVFPHTSQQYERHGRNKEKYNIRPDLLSNKYFALCIIAMLFDNLDLTISTRSGLVV